MPCVVPRSVRCGAAAVLAASALAGCAGEGGDRDDFDEAWSRTASLVPDRQRVVEDPDVCEGVLGDLRTARQELPEAPDSIVSGAVDDWFAVAEATFFECPPSGGELDGFAAAYDELTEARRAVDAALDDPPTDEQADR